jgi:hypothetical protein
MPVNKIRQAGIATSEDNKSWRSHRHVEPSLTPQQRPSVRQLTRKSPAKLRLRAQRTAMTVRAGLRGARTSNHTVMGGALADGLVAPSRSGLGMRLAGA